MCDYKRQHLVLFTTVIHIHYIFTNVIHPLILCCIINEDIMYIYECMALLSVSYHLIWLFWVSLIISYGSFECLWSSLHYGSFELSLTILSYIVLLYLIIRIPHPETSRGQGSPVLSRTVTLVLFIVVISI